MIRLSQIKALSLKKSLKTNLSLKNLNNEAIDGGALFSVVVVALIVAIIISAIILTAFYQRYQVSYNYRLIRLERNAESAVLIALNKTSAMTQETLDLYGNGTDSVSYQLLSWGIFDIVKAKAFHRTDTAYRAYLIEQNIEKYKDLALYMTDQSKPLYVCGNTSLKGTCYLPESGVKSGSIEGVQFQSRTLIDGTRQISSYTLPEINPTKLKRIEALLFQNNIPLFLGTTEYNTIPSLSHKYAYPFTHATSVLHSNQEIVIASGQKISGNLIVYSTKAITISEQAIVEDVIFVAPTIRIDNKVEGILQAYASDSLIVGEYVKLSYPSAICLFQKENTTTINKCVIKDNAEIQGFVCLYTKSVDKMKSTLYINKQTKIIGQVYSNAYLSHKGQIYGCVFVNNFIHFSASGNVYVNHLLDATIDRSKLPQSFVGSIIDDQKRKYQRIKAL